MAEDKQATGTVTTTETPVIVTPTKAETAKSTTTLADGGDGEDQSEYEGDSPAEKTVTTWPKDWRTLAAGEDKAALKTLARFTDPAAMSKAYMALRKRVDAPPQARPADGATEEDVAAYRKTAGIPEKIEDYAKAIKLPDGMVVGEADKPIVDSFAQMAHGKNFPPDVVAAFFDKYQEIARKQVDQQTEFDDRFAQESRDALRDEWGPQDYKRNVNASASLFREMPKEVADAILTARTSDGRLVGNIPEFVKWGAQTALELNPAASVFPSGGAQPGKGPVDRLNEIRDLRRTKPNEYNAKAKEFEAEEIQLNEAIIKMQRRGQKAA